MASPSILDILIKELDPKTDDPYDQQVREICDQIKEQEEKNLIHPELAPSGPRVYLVVSCPGKYDWEIGFLTLEKEDKDSYVIVHHTLEKSRINKENPVYPRRKKVWGISEYKAKKVLKEFATILKHIRGE